MPVPVNALVGMNPMNNITLDKARKLRSQLTLAGFNVTELVSILHFGLSPNPASAEYVPEADIPETDTPIEIFFRIKGVEQSPHNAAQIDRTFNYSGNPPTVSSWIWTYCMTNPYADFNTALGILLQQPAMQEAAEKLGLG